MSENIGERVTKICNTIKHLTDDFGHAVNSTTLIVTSAISHNIPAVITNLTDITINIPTFLNDAIEAYKVFDENIKDLGKIQDSKEVQESIKNMSEAFNKTFDTLKIDATSIINDIGKLDPKLGNDVVKIFTDITKGVESIVNNGQKLSDEVTKTLNETKASAIMKDIIPSKTQGNKEVPSQTMNNQQKTKQSPSL